MNDLFIKADGSMVAVKPQNAKKGYSLNDLYTMLNCSMVEVVYPRNPPKEIKDAIMICDEEALIGEPKPYNHAASVIAGFSIVGDVLLCASKNFK
jgi:hypothetical protein